MGSRVRWKGAAWNGGSSLHGYARAGPTAILLALFTVGTLVLRAPTVAPCSTVLVLLLVAANALPLPAPLRTRTLPPALLATVMLMPPLAAAGISYLLVALPPPGADIRTRLRDVGLAWAVLVLAIGGSPGSPMGAVLALLVWGALLAASPSRARRPGWAWGLPAWILAAGVLAPHPLLLAGIVGFALAAPVVAAANRTGLSREPLLSPEAEAWLPPVCGALVLGSARRAEGSILAATVWGAYRLGRAAGWPPGRIAALPWILVERRALGNSNAVRSDGGQVPPAAAEHPDPPPAHPASPEDRLLEAAHRIATALASEPHDPHGIPSERRLREGLLDVLVRPAPPVLPPSRFDTTACTDLLRSIGFDLVHLPPLALLEVRRHQGGAKAEHNRHRQRLETTRNRVDALLAGRRVLTPDSLGLLSRELSRVLPDTTAALAGDLAGRGREVILTGSRGKSDLIRAIVTMARFPEHLPGAARAFPIPGTTAQLVLACGRPPCLEDLESMGKAVATSIARRTDLHASFYRPHLAPAHDPLTGLARLRALEDAIAEALETEALPRFALLVLSIRNLDTINDRFGHAAGDEALRAVSRTLQAMLRADDLPARLGGRTMGALLRGCGPQETRQVRERLEEALTETTLHPDDAGEPGLPVDLGTALAPEDGREPATLLRAARSRCRAASRSKRTVSVLPRIA